MRTHTAINKLNVAKRFVISKYTRLKMSVWVVYFSLVGLLCGDKCQVSKYFKTERVHVQHFSKTVLSTLSMCVHRSHMSANSFIIVSILLFCPHCGKLLQKDTQVPEAGLREVSLCSCQETGSCVCNPKVTKLLICFVIFLGSFRIFCLFQC